MSRQIEDEDDLTYRLFLSSPSDVKPEREAADRVVRRINSELPEGAGFELIRWEDDYYTADSTFQEQIVLSSECDIVICIFWKRLGSDLPPQYRRPDGTLPTGTEYEFELALDHAVQSAEKTPDILIYRKTAEVTFSERTLQVEREQRERFLAFWRKWFRNEKGHFVAGFHSFPGTKEFEVLVDKHLRTWLADRDRKLVWTKGSPFRGLKPFDVEHAPIYFGRRRESERVRARVLANLLSEERFLLILGPSGSGKSSLVRAGVLPRLMHAGGANGLPHLDLYLVTSPGALKDKGLGNWTHGLAKALFSHERLGPALRDGDFDTPEKLAALFEQGGALAVAPVGRALARIRDTQGLILVIDQFEEQFSWKRSDTDAFSALVECLARHVPVAVIATMRSEFQYRLGEFPALERLCGLRDVAGPSQPLTTIDIGQPSMADIREMIVQSAAAAGLDYEGPVRNVPALDTRIERDSGPATLPAMQLLLSELFERRQDHLLVHKAYDDLGGVPGVMASRGDAVLAGMQGDISASFGRLVRALVQTDASGKVVISKRISIDLFDPASTESDLALALQDAGLLTSSGDSLRLAHESLLDGWKALKDVVAQEAQNLAVRNRIVAQYRGFQDAQAKDSKKARAAYLRDLPLQEAVALLADWGPDAVEDTAPGLADFIRVSARAEKQRRLLRAGLGASALIVTVVFVMAVLFFQLRSAENAKTALLRGHLRTAEAALREEQWDRALLAAQEALQIEEDFDTRSMALTALLNHRSRHFVSEDRGNTVAVATGPNGRVSVLREDGEILLQHRAQEVRYRLPEIPPNLTGVTYAHLWNLTDGGVVVLRNDGLAYHLRSIGSDGLALSDPTVISDENFNLFFSGQADLTPSGTGFRLALGDLGQKNGLMLDCRIIGDIVDCKSALIEKSISAVAFSSDGRVLATASRDGLVLRDVSGPDGVNRTLDLEGEGISLAWMNADRMLVAGLRDGRMIAITLGGDGNLHAVARNTVNRPDALPDAAQPIMLQAPSPDDRRLAFSCAAERICIASLLPDGSGLAVQDIIYRLTRPPRNMIWTSDGSTLLTVQAGGLLSRWDANPKSSLAKIELLAEAPLLSLAVDAPRNRLAVGTETGSVFVVSGGSFHQETLGDGEIRHLAYAKDGRLAAVTSNGTIARFATLPDGAVDVAETGEELQRVIWLDDGKTLAVTSAKALFFWTEGEEVQRRSVAEIGAEQGHPPGLTFGGLTASVANDGVVFSVSDGALYRATEAAISILLPPELTSDRLSSLSLDFDPSGRYLVVTRSDDKVRVYDLAANKLAVELGIPTPDSKVVKFSPNGRRLAVLASSGQVHLWEMDLGASSATPYMTFFPEPQLPFGSSAKARTRQTIWLDWLDDQTLALATQPSGAVLINVDWLKIRERMIQLGAGRAAE